VIEAGVRVISQEAAKGNQMIRANREGGFPSEFGHGLNRIRELQLDLLDDIRHSHSYHPSSGMKGDYARSLNLSALTFS
jgi:hypothetical protein